MQFHASALDPAHIQDIVDEFQQMVSGIQDLVQAVLHSFFIIDMFECDPREAQNSVHGRPDIVGHIGQEQALGPVRVPGPLQSVFQKTPLLLFCLPLVLDTGKSDNHFIENIRVLTHPYDLCPVIHGCACSSRPESKGKEILIRHISAECFSFHKIDEFLSVLLIDRLFREKPGRLLERRHKTIRIRGHDMLIAAVDLIGIAVKIHQINGRIVQREGRDQVHTPAALPLYGLLFSNIPQYSQSGHVSCVGILCHQNGLTQIDFPVPSVPDLIGEINFVVPVPIGFQQCIPGEDPVIDLSFLRKDQTFPPGFRDQSERTGNIHSGNIIEYIRVVHFHRKHNSLGDVEFKDALCFLQHGDLVSLLLFQAAPKYFQVILQLLRVCNIIGHRNGRAGRAAPRQRLSDHDQFRKAVLFFEQTHIDLHPVIAVAEGEHKAEKILFLQHFAYIFPASRDFTPGSKRCVRQKLAVQPVKDRVGGSIAYQFR